MSHNLSSGQPRRHSAGLFDIRNVVGALLAMYGVILVLVWAFGGTAPAGTSGRDNLWTGIALLFFGVVFLAWAWLRPIMVTVTTSKKEPLDKPPTAP